MSNKIITIGEYHYNYFGYFLNEAWPKYDLTEKLLLYDTISTALPNMSSQTSASVLDSFNKQGLIDKWIWRGIFDMEFPTISYIATDSAKYAVYSGLHPGYGFEPDIYNSIIMNYNIFNGLLTYRDKAVSEDELYDSGNIDELVLHTYNSNIDDSLLVDILCTNSTNGIVDLVSGNRFTISNKVKLTLTQNAYNSTYGGFCLLNGAYSNGAPAAYIKLSQLPRFCEYMETSTSTNNISIVAELGQCGTVDQKTIYDNIIGLWHCNNSNAPRYGSNVNYSASLLNLLLSNSTDTNKVFIGAGNSTIEVDTTYRSQTIGSQLNYLHVFKESTIPVLSKEEKYVINDVGYSNVNTSSKNANMFLSTVYAREIGRYNSWLVLGGEYFTSTYSPSISQGGKGLVLKRIKIYGSNALFKNKLNTIVDINFDTNTPYDMISRVKLMAQYGTATRSYITWNTSAHGAECTSTDTYNLYYWDVNKMEKFKHFLKHWTPALSYKVTIEYYIKTAWSGTTYFVPVSFYNANGYLMNPAFIATPASPMVSSVFNENTLHKTVYYYDANTHTEYITNIDQSGLVRTTSWIGSESIRDAIDIFYENSTDCRMYMFNLLAGTNHPGVILKKFKIEKVTNGTELDIANNYHNYDDVLTFSSADPTSTIKYNRTSGTTAIFLYRLYDDINKQWGGWMTWNLDTAISLSYGQSLQVQNINSVETSISTSDTNYLYFTMTGSIIASGNVGSLLIRDYNKNMRLHNISGAYAFYKLFYNCTALQSAPDLPTPDNGVSIGPYAYSLMFYGCANIKSAMLDIPGTSFNANACKLMFFGCASLLTPPRIHATDLSGACCLQMFYGCSALNIPDTTYILPAIDLQPSCYSMMFYNCTSLERTPILPAKVLVSLCYSNMFNGCTKLKYVHAAFTTVPGTLTTPNWLANTGSSASGNRKQFSKAVVDSQSGWLSSNATTTVRYSSSTHLVSYSSINTIPANWYINENNTVGYYYEDSTI